MWYQHITLYPPIVFLPIFLTGGSSEDITIMTIGRICVGEVLRAKQAPSLNCHLSLPRRVASSALRRGQQMEEDGEEGNSISVLMSSSHFFAQRIYPPVSGWVGWPLVLKGSPRA